MYLGTNYQTVVTPGVTTAHTDVITHPKMRVKTSLQHYDQDHGDHILHRTVQTNIDYTPSPEQVTYYTQEPDEVEHMPINHLYSIPVHHTVNTQHVDYKQSKRVEDVVSKVPRTIKHEDKKIRKVPYQVTMYKEEPYTEVSEETVYDEVHTPVTHIDTIPVIHNQQEIVTKNTVVAVPAM